MGYERARAGVAAMAHAGLGLGEAAILLEVAGRTDIQTISAISRSLRQPLSSISRQAWALAEHGFLAYRKSRLDRRTTEISITPKGHALVQHFFEETA